SDGVLDPVRLVHEAQIAKLQKIAITDHDTVDGLVVLKKAGFLDRFSSAERPHIITGIELNADFPGYEVHILGYFIDIENEKLRSKLKLLVENRRQRLLLMVEKISSLGYDLKYEDVVELALNSTAIGRPHVAKALLRTGYFKNIKHVFDTLLSKGCPAYIPQYRLPLAEVTEIIRAAGGVAVLAHPGLVGNDTLVLKIINQADIIGLEVYHPTHDAAQVEKYSALALKHNLKITGGSDFHGIAGRFPEKLGIFYVPADLADSLREAR
ncbi:MAG: PHP domain-containing protein, partial [Sporomusaceae bacterium]|nr:PHP domain-containing protein [Sporomusaceae bacterium]